MTRLFFHTLAGRRVHHHIAATRVAAGESTFTHTHDFPEFFLMLEGSGIHRWNGVPVPVERGDLTLVLPADVHSFEGGETAPFQLVNLALAPEWWRDFAALAGSWSFPGRPRDAGSARHRRLHAADADACGRHLRGLLATESGDPALLVEAVAVLLRALRSAPAPRGSGPDDGLAGAPDWLQRLVRELQERESTALPLSHWQKRSNRSPEHLARCCRRYLGCTLTELLIRARLERVKADLREGGGKIASVAYDAGFQNLGYFYRTFRRVEGTTPKRWASAHAGGPTVPR
jgi:AraC family cel operon transcriptional repressor